MHAIISFVSGLIPIFAFIYDKTTYKEMKAILILFMLFWSILGVKADDGQNPYLKQVHNSTQLIVDGKPFLMLAGELHNSATGSAESMRAIWHRLAKMNYNTVLAPVSWEMIEPEEGKFHFEMVDSMVAGARKNHLRLVVLWFGSWKNAKSSYAPAWVKLDRKRFPLAMRKNGSYNYTLSPHSRNTLEADKKAFCELMAHIKSIDSRQHTVIMVQVENEVGTLAESGGLPPVPNIAMRDYSPAANRAFHSNVPSTLITWMQTHQKQLHPAIAAAWAANGRKTKGTWEQVFGTGKAGKTYTQEEIIRILKHLFMPSKEVQLSTEELTAWMKEYPYITEEIFNAWSFASYINEIAGAGKAVYPLPMYVNAWQKTIMAREPGRYPSGGPQAHLKDIWQAAAPNIDFLAPDIYMTEFYSEICDGYTKGGRPLFIPETTAAKDGAARAFYTFGKYNTLGYSPFGVNGGGLYLSADTTDTTYRQVYEYLSYLTPMITRYQGTSDIAGLLIDKNHPSDKVVMGDYTISIKPYSNANVFSTTGALVKDNTKDEENVAGLLVIRLGTNDFLVAGGVGELAVNIRSNKGATTDYLSVDELRFDTPKNVYYHRLNGDEISSANGPVIQKGQVKAFRIKVFDY
jgi:beta-galactosidase GanA